MKVIDDINHKFGARSSFILGEDSGEEIDVVPTGSFRLDAALGVGGFPRGRIIEIYGMESSGKTTLCVHHIANLQAMGGVAAFVDVEHALDPYWLDVCGVDPTKLIISQPDSGEQALDIVEMYIRSKEIDTVVVDSVAALAPRAEIEGEMGDAHMALVARLMSQAMRKLVGVVKQSNTTVIFTNQLRQNIGGYGNPETTTGGLALRFYASVRVELKKAGILNEKIKVDGKDIEEPVGTKIRATVRKNKVAPPLKVAEFDIYYNEGISLLSELIDVGSSLGLIDKGGAGWYTVNDVKIQGMPALRASLKTNPDLLQFLEDRVRIHFGLPIRRIEE